MKKGGNNSGQLRAFRIMRVLAVPIFFFAIVMVSGWRPRWLTGGLPVDGGILHWMLLVSALFTAGRARFTALNYALCFLPVFLFLLIVFFSR